MRAISRSTRRRAASSAWPVGTARSTWRSTASPPCEGAARNALFARSGELDVGLDLPRQPDRGDGHRRFRRKLLGALEAAVGQGVAHRLLDLALCGHAQGLEKL